MAGLTWLQDVDLEAFDKFIMKKFNIKENEAPKKNETVITAAQKETIPRSAPVTTSETNKTEQAKSLEGEKVKKENSDSIKNVKTTSYIASNLTKKSITSSVSITGNISFGNQNPQSSRVPTSTPSSTPSFTPSSTTTSTPSSTTTSTPSSTTTSTPSPSSKSELWGNERCGGCSGCSSPRGTECGTCSNCLDKPKFGGQGRKRQVCVLRKCTKTQPQQPRNQQPPPTQAPQKSNNKLTTAGTSKPETKLIDLTNDKAKPEVKKGEVIDVDAKGGKGASEDTVRCKLCQAVLRNERELLVAHCRMYHSAQIAASRAAKRPAEGPAPPPPAPPAGPGRTMGTPGPARSWPGRSLGAPEPTGAGAGRSSGSPGAMGAPGPGGPSRTQGSPGPAGWTRGPAGPAGWTRGPGGRPGPPGPRLVAG